MLLNLEIKTACNVKDDLIPAFAKVCEWLRHNNLSLNAIKTEFMIIGSHQRVGRLDSTFESTPYIIQLGDMMIKRVTKVKYLGFVVDENLCWDEHVEYISEKISRNIGIIKHMRSILPLESLTSSLRSTCCFSTASDCLNCLQLFPKSTLDLTVVSLLI